MTDISFCSLSILKIESSVIPIFLLFTVDAVIAGMLLSINIDKKPMLPGIYAAINEMFHNPPDPFFTGRVMDILYDGVPIDCTSEDMTVTAMCTSFSTGEQKAIRQIDDKHYAFSLFAGVSATPSTARLIRY